MKNILEVTLGKDEKNHIIFDDVTTMPHVLLGGTTGSGKSTFLHSLLLSLMETYTPQQVQLIIIDPKRVEFMGYRGLPHLLLDIVTTPERTKAVLEWLVKRMLQTYTELERVQARNIEEYNQKTGEHLPYIVIVIDELADLMIHYAKYIQIDIQRLCQLGRAAGIHVILATQHPSVKVIPGVIKANIPTRISFKTRSLSDSRVILDIRGAEKLPPHGTMLFSSPKHIELMAITVPNITSYQLQKRLQKPMHLTDEEKKLAQKTGREGGNTTLKKYGKAHFSKIGKGWIKGKPRKKPLEKPH